MIKEETLAKASKDLMLKEPFYGFFLIMLNKMWNTRGVKTAAVSKNGINYQLMIDETFWTNLPELHKLGILKHELLHIALFHLTSHHKYSNHGLANIAMDMEINQLIDSDWLPSANMTKEDYDDTYKPLIEKLAQDLKDEVITVAAYMEAVSKIPMRPILIQDYDDLDLEANAGTRYYYDKLRKAKEEKDDKGTSGCGNFDKLCDQLDKEGDPCEHGSWSDFDNLTEAEEKLMDKQLNRLIQEAANQTVKKRGTIPGELRDHLIKINEVVKAKFDWRSYVRRFTGNSQKIYTKKLRRKHNKRYEGNPGLKIKMKQHMLLGIDTSGSVCDDELREFMNEIHHMYKTGVAITIIQCDTSIVSIEEYKGHNDEVSIGGRGGTSFDPVIDYFNANLKKYTSLVYFTDGEAWTDLKPKAPTLWVLSERSSMNDSLPGKVIKLEL